jgi:competence protein ComEA
VAVPDPQARLDVAMGGVRLSATALALARSRGAPAPPPPSAAAQAAAPAQPAVPPHSTATFRTAPTLGPALTLQSAPAAQAAATGLPAGVAVPTGAALPAGATQPAATFQSAATAQAAAAPIARPASAGSVVARVRDVAARHTKAVAVLGLAAVVVTVWTVLHAQTWSPEAVGLVASPSADSSPTPEPSPTPTPWLVHVLGAVNAPGLVEVTPGARVADALAQAGGLAADADPAELNLAAVLQDGAQVVIGTSADPMGEVRTGSGSPGASGSEAGSEYPLVDLNTATQAQLETLPGVGPVTAQAILAWRAQHGRFTTTEELQEIDGIGAKTYAQLAPRVRV